MQIELSSDLDLLGFIVMEMRHVKKLSETD